MSLYRSKTLGWIDQVLFGSSEPELVDPPDELTLILVKFDLDGLVWEDMSRNGGITQLPYNIYGDLNAITDYLEKRFVDKHSDATVPTLKVKAVTRFLHHLMSILAKGVEPECPSLLPFVTDKTDAAILNAFLSHPDDCTQTNFQYTSASFWGEMTRRLLMHRRPAPKELAPLAQTDSWQMERAMMLYDVTCKTRGQMFDPLTMYLVPRSEYVDAACWQSDRLLEAYVHAHPNEQLANSVKRLVCQSIRNVLEGRRPTILSDDDIPQLDNFLKNVNAVHASIRQVPLLHQEKETPKTIDVFQRLLALTQYDWLWAPLKEDDAATASDSSCLWSEDAIDPAGIRDKIELLERLYFAERQNKILLEHIGD